MFTPVVSHVHVQSHPLPSTCTSPGSIIFEFSFYHLCYDYIVQTLFRLTTPRGDTKRWLLFPEVFRSRLIVNIFCGRPRKEKNECLIGTGSFWSGSAVICFSAADENCMFVSWLVPNNSYLYITLMNPAHKFLVSNSLSSIKCTILMTSSVEINTQFINILENHVIFYTQCTKLS